ncbi:hypothetical protein ABPG72_015778 [Tetrahymena utriculariae]
MSSSKLQQQQKYQIHSQAEENPKMKEIFDALLQAGYFRIRIPSIQTFDKILGSLTWCISCSNFDIDIEYDDEMNLGQKIALSEKICEALQKMKCPFELLPFQIKGLDFDKMYPVFNWLIKFVYETREERWDFNTSMSNFLGKKTYPSFIERQKKEENTINETIKIIQTVDKRQTKNVNAKNLQLNDPIRIYSTLIEYGDITAIKTYNKLSGVVSGKIDLENEIQKQSKGKSKSTRDASESGKSKKEVDKKINDIIFYDQASSKSSKVEVDTGRINALISASSQQPQFMQLNQTNVEINDRMFKPQEATFKRGKLAQMTAPQFAQVQIGANSSGNDGSLQSQLTQALNAMNQQSVTTGSAAADSNAQSNLEPENDVEFQVEGNNNFTDIRAGGRRQSVVGANLMELIAQGQDDIKEAITKTAEADESPEIEFTNIIKTEKEFHEKQVIALNQKIADLQKKLQEETEELKKIKEEEEEKENYYDKHTGLDNELKETRQLIEKKLQQAKARSKELIAEAEMNVQKRNALKEQKTKLRKEIKIQIQESEKEMEKTKKEATLLEDQQDQGEEFSEDYIKKKEKLNKKTEELSKFNQDNAVLQRQLENFPSASEIAQYQLRLLELYESISSESEREKDNYLRYNNYCDIKTQLVQFVEIMKAFKENYQVHKKSKSGRTKFIGDLTEAYKGLEENCQKALELLTKIKNQRERKMEDFNQLKVQERDYFKLLKDFRLELEVNDTLQQRQ